MLYRVNGATEVTPVPESTTANEALLEAHFEDWVARTPDVLGEDLLVIGKQVSVDSGRDRIDLLALDLQGSAVIIELKRDWIGTDADLQAIRYASLVAGWDHAAIRRLAEEYWLSSGQQRRTFTQELDEFCDDGYEVNSSQRIILAGRRVDPRLGTMVMWLLERGIDVRVVTLSLFRDDDRLYLQPQVVLPVPTEAGVVARPAPDQADKEWRRDGRAWHLEQQLNPHGRAILEALAGLIKDAVPDADGPLWGQKQYVSWKAGPKNWLGCYTDSPNQATVFVRGLEHLPAPELAAQLGWVTFEPGAELALKLASGSSVGLDNKGRMRFTIKAVEDLTGPSRDVLAKLLLDGWENFSLGKAAAPAW